MSRKFYIYLFFIIFFISFLSLYFYNYYATKTFTCHTPEMTLRSRNFGITALTASGSIYMDKEGNKTFQFSSRNASIVIDKNRKSEYIVSLKVGNTVLLRSMISGSSAKLMVFNGSNKGNYEIIGNNFLLWLKPCYITPVMKKLGLSSTPKYLGEKLKFSISPLHKFVQSSVFFYFNGTDNYSVVYRKVHVLRNTMEVEGPIFSITDEYGNHLYDKEYYSGVFLCCGVPVSLSVIVPAKYVNMTGLEKLIGYKPKYGKYISYYSIYWDTNWSQIEHIKCRRPLFFSDIQVAALSVVAGLIGVLVIWVLKRGS